MPVEGNKIAVMPIDVATVVAVHLKTIKYIRIDGIFVDIHLLSLLNIPVLMIVATSFGKTTSYRVRDQVLPVIKRRNTKLLVHRSSWSLEA